MPQTIRPEAPLTTSAEETAEEISGEVSLADGQIVRVEAGDGEVSLTPDLPLSAYRGFLEGMAVDDVRDKTDRF
jgi:hypothetical protein